MKSGNYDFGMIGLGVMGANILLNMADHGYSVVGFDLSAEKTAAFEKSGKQGQELKGVNSLQELVDNLKPPRKMMMLVPAGKAVDSVIGQLTPLLEKGDIIIDGGNSHYTDSLDRINKMKGTGIHFMGVGISGGEDGARFGPSIMPGGDKEAWDEVKKILRDISAKVNGEPCVDYMGKDAAGHYVKMVHNGIEYAIMQLIAECYDLLKNGAGMNNKELGELFEKWDDGDLKSFLLEITGDIFKVQDPESDAYLVDRILDRAGAKGTGKWTVESTLELPLPAPSIDAAVMFRNMSSLVEERRDAAGIYTIENGKIDTDRAEIKGLLYDAFYFATVIAYAQGLAQISAASEKMEMEVPLPQVVKVWRGGCIIRSALLSRFAEIYEKEPGLKNLLLDKNIAYILQQKLTALQKVLKIAVANNYAVPGLMSAFSYFNSYRRGTLPTNLVQAQRDYFGAHTYERIDKEGIFHTSWKTAKKKH